MGQRKYYAERKGILQPEPMDFEMLKKVFVSAIQQFEHDLYFLEATGYPCVDDRDLRGIWGSDADAFFYMQLKMTNLWPIEENIERYDEPTLFTVIEFLYDYVSYPINPEYHSYYNCGWHATDFDKERGQKEYGGVINKILKDYSEGYRLTENGEVQRIPPTGLETIIEEIVKTEDPENIDTRIQNAISKYLRHDATVDDKKDAIKKLAEVLEFLKKGGITLPKKDDNDLFNILNNFDIRHHNRSQKGEYNREVWYDWMFYTFLASINTLLRLNKESPIGS